jgi:hypothetical protein
VSGALHLAQFFGSGIIGHQVWNVFTSGPLQISEPKAFNLPLDLMPLNRLPIKNNRGPGFKLGK